jgi:hypothetical protein
MTRHLAGRYEVEPQRISDLALQRVLEAVSLHCAMHDAWISTAPLSQAMSCERLIAVTAPGYERA